MRRKKRIAIRMVALGLAVAGLSAPAAQATLDEGFNGLQPLSIEPVLVTADDIGRPTAGTTQGTVDRQILSADDMVGRVTPTPSQPILVSSDGGYEFWPVTMGGMLLLLGAGVVLIAVQQTRRKLATA